MMGYFLNFTNIYTGDNPTNNLYQLIKINIIIVNSF